MSDEMNVMSDENENNHKKIGLVGLEPTRGCPHRILNPVRLPFRHSPNQFNNLNIDLIIDHSLEYSSEELN